MVVYHLTFEFRCWIVFWFETDPGSGKEDCVVFSFTIVENERWMRRSLEMHLPERGSSSMCTMYTKLATVVFRCFAVLARKCCDSSTPSAATAGTANWPAAATVRHLQRTWLASGERTPAWPSRKCGCRNQWYHTGFHRFRGPCGKCYFGLAAANGTQSLCPWIELAHCKHAQIYKWSTSATGPNGGLSWDQYCAVWSSQRWSISFVSFRW